MSEDLCLLACKQDGLPRVQTALMLSVLQAPCTPGICHHECNIIKAWSACCRVPNEDISEPAEEQLRHGSESAAAVLPLAPFPFLPVPVHLIAATPRVP